MGHEAKAAKIARILCPETVLPPPVENVRSTNPGLLGAVKHWLKANTGLYDRLVSLFSPVRPSPQYDRVLSDLLSLYGPEAVVLNLGSGPCHFRGRDDFINVDLFALPCVDIQADARRVPVQDGCADLLLNIAMLEHVPAPDQVVAEMRRLLRPGGEVFVFLPFLQPFHGAPGDFQRWTMSGAKDLFSGFSQVEVGVGAGPASAWLWTGLEFFSLLFSFGNQTVKDVLFLAVMPLLSPLKHLDLLLCRHPDAMALASGFYVRARK